MKKFKFTQRVLMEVWCETSFTVEAIDEADALMTVNEITRNHIDVSEECDVPGVDFINSKYRFDTAKYVVSRPDQPANIIVSESEDSTEKIISAS